MAEDDRRGSRQVQARCKSRQRRRDCRHTIASYGSRSLGKVLSKSRPHPDHVPPLAVVTTCRRVSLRTSSRHPPPRDASRRVFRSFFALRTAHGSRLLCPNHYLTRLTPRYSSLPLACPNATHPPTRPFPPTRLSRLRMRRTSWIKHAPPKPYSVSSRFPP